MKLINIEKAFGQTIIFSDVNLDLTKNGVIFISGKSGCGKTTLLNIIAGLDQPSNGQIIDHYQVSMILQDYPLLERLTVKDNIFLGQTKVSRYMVSIVKKLDLIPLLYRKAKTLSAGQKQRVAIARTLINKPDVLLCDEPTASLDKANKQIVMDLLAHYGKNHPVIVASHDTELIQHYANALYSFSNQRLICQYDDRTREFKFKPNKKMVRPQWIKLVFKYHFKPLVFLGLTILCITTGILWLNHLLSLQLQPPIMQQRYSDNWMMINNVDDLSILHGPDTKTRDDDWIHGPIVPNMDLRINQRGFKGRVLPLPNQVIDQYELSYTHLIANDQCDVIINQPLSMVYTIDKVDYPLTMVVETIVEEPKTSSCILYYDPNHIQDYLSDQTTEDGLNQWDELMATNINWYLQTTRLPMIEWNMRMAEKQFIDASSVYLDEVDAFNMHVATYRIMFKVIFIIIVTLLIIMTFNGFTKVYRNDLNALFILNLYRIPLTKIKILVLTMDMLWISIMLGIVYGLTIILTHDPFDMTTWLCLGLIILSTICGDFMAMAHLSKTNLYQNYQTTKGSTLC